MLGNYERLYEFANGNTDFGIILEARRKHSSNVTRIVYVAGRFEIVNI